MSEDRELLDGVFTELAEAKSVAPRWVIKDLLPVGMSFVGGAPKCNKSTLTMAMACLVSGLKCKVLPPFLSTVEDHGRVLILSAEASAGELKSMVLNQMYVEDLSQGHILVADDPFEWRLDSEQDSRRLLNYFNMLTPKLVIIDPLADFHEQDEKEAGPMIRMLRPLRQWAITNYSALVLVHHTRKQETGVPNAVSRPSELRGSGAMFGKADSTLMVTRHDDDSHTINATFKRGTSWERKILMRAFGRKSAAREHMDNNTIKVLKALEVQPVPDKELAKRCQMTLPRTLEALAKLTRNGFIAPDKKRFLILKDSSTIGL